jgi:HEAT repeat protein
MHRIIEGALTRLRAVLMKALVASLGQIGGNQAVQILGDVLLQHSQARMRLLAAQALQREDSPEALQYLEAAAGDADPQIRALIAAPPRSAPKPLPSETVEEE